MTRGTPEPRGAGTPTSPPLIRDTRHADPTAEADGSVTLPPAPPRRRDEAASVWAARRAALRRTPAAMWHENVSDWAAALTYYAILALLPSLLVTVSLISVVSADGTDELIADITAWAPAGSGGTLDQVLRDMAHERSAALTLIVVGGISALWSASSYLAVFRRVLHTFHNVEDTKPAWRKAHRIVLTAVALLALLVTSAFVLVLSGPPAKALVRHLGVPEAGATLWSLLRWLVLVCLVALLVLVLFRTGPVQARGLHNALPGGVLASLLWLTTSAGFTVYASMSGTYSKLYGSLAGSVVFLVWLWLSHLALLAGARFNAALSQR